MSTWRILFCIAAAAGLMAGCGAPPSINYQTIDRYDNVIAQADTGYALTLKQLYEKVEKSQALPQGGLMTEAEVTDELDRTLVDTLAGLAADTVQLEKYWDYQRLYRLRYNDYLIRRYGQAEIFDKVQVDSASVDSFYAANPERFTRKAQVFVAHILVTPFGMKYTEDSLNLRVQPPESLEVAAERHIRKIKGMLDEGQDFKEVARTYSQDTQARARKGVLGWVEAGVYEDPFDSVAFSIPVGTHSEPYHSPNGWHILHVRERRPETLLPLDSTVRKQIVVHLKSKGADEAARPLVDSLDKAMVLAVNESILDTNLYLVDKKEWAAVVNGQDTLLFADLHMLEDAYRRRNRIENTTVEMKHQMIREASRKLTFVQAARAARIDTLPDVRAEEQSLRHQYQKVIYLLASRDDTWMPPDSAVEKYYNAHLQEFEVTKPLVVQQIVMADSAAAVFVRDQAAAGSDFLELADEYYPGEPDIRRSLADLGEIGPGDVSPEFYEMARVTPVGMVSNPVKTEYGWHIIKVLEHREPMSLGQARQKVVPVLKEQHQREVFNAFRDDLYRRYNVRFPGRIQPLFFRSLAARTAPADEGQEPVTAEAGTSDTAEGNGTVDGK